MTSSDSILTSSFSEQRWTDQISKNFDKDVAISNIPISVFTVPKSISAYKPEAYVPQAIGLGPYHHFNTELYHMERYKVVSVQSFLISHKIFNFQTLLINKLKKLEPTIRACYHKYLDLDDDTLAWVISIDGLFLLDLLLAYADNSVSKTLTHSSMLCRDILILENQFPVIVLNELRKTLKLVDVEEKIYDDKLYQMLRNFCMVHSPLPLTAESELVPGTKIMPLHLLDLMYFLILNTRGTKKGPGKSYSKNTGKELEVTNKVAIENQDLVLNVNEILDVSISLGIGGDTLKPVQVLKNLPWEKIYNLLGLKDASKVDNANPLIIEEISIPSVTYLSNVGGLKFKPTGGIRDMELNEKEATLYLPILTINDKTEAVLRNLVAYEAAISGFELAQYVDLMSGIIDTAEDATVLIKQGIIKGELAADKIADIFNGMNKSSAKVGNQTLEKIKDYFNEKTKVKVYRFWQNRILDSWKVLTIVSTILLLLLLILQSFCGVYGCTRGRVN